MKYFTSCSLQLKDFVLFSRDALYEQLALLLLVFHNICYNGGSRIFLTLVMERLRRFAPEGVRGILSWEILNFKALEIQFSRFRAIQNVFLWASF